MGLPASATASPAVLTAAPAPDHILQIGFGFWASKTLLSAVEMEVFTELAKHHEDLEELTGRLGLHPRSARAGRGRSRSGNVGSLFTRLTIGRRAPAI